MDCRRLLFGIAALSLLGTLNLDDLTAQVDTPKAGVKKVYPPDADLSVPRGPIKMCVEETTLWDDKVYTTITEYGIDGKVISTRSGSDGKIDLFTDNTIIEVRDDQNRLTKSTTRNENGTSHETYYAYDSAGRMLATTNNENSDQIQYSYGRDGAMTTTHTFDSATFERSKGSAFAGAGWDGAYLGIGVPTGGRVVVSYDKDENGTDMRILAPDGTLITHVERKFDEHGQLVQEKPIQENTAYLLLDRMPPEQRAAVSPKELAAMNVFWSGKKPSETTYTYDDEGRLTGSHSCNAMFEETKTIRYNEHGDRIEEHTTQQNNSRFEPGVPYSIDENGEFYPTKVVLPDEQKSFLPPERDVHYTYKYDDHGNWTERIETDGRFTRTTHRTLTYY